MVTKLNFMKCPSGNPGRMKDSTHESYKFCKNEKIPLQLKKNYARITHKLRNLD